MSLHSGSLTADRPILYAETVPYVETSEHAMVAGRQKPASEASASADAAQFAPGQEAASSVAPRRSVRRALLAGASLVVLAAVGYFGWEYWTAWRFQVSTDDAYVQADNTTIAPRVSGYLSGVLVADNEVVKAGQVLARIDDRDFRVALDQAKADVLAAIEQPLMPSSRSSTAQRRRSTSIAPMRPSPSRTTNVTRILRRQATAVSRMRSRQRPASRRRARPSHAIRQRSRMRPSRLIF